MKKAIYLANKAELNGEVPVGAVLIMNNKIISTGLNSSIYKHDPTAHAEIVALRRAALVKKNYRLFNTTIYVTLEPCIMCFGALINSRIKRLVIGAINKKRNVVDFLFKELGSSFFNHKISITSNVMEKECSLQLKNFFKRIRKNNF